MTFQGNINTIHLPTIFQLFYFSTKTGALEVGIDELSYTVYLYNGNICNVETNFLKTNLLELYFIKEGLSPKDIKDILSKSTKQNEVMNALISSGKVKKEHIEELKQGQIKQLLLDIVGIEFGKFTFRAMENKDMEKHRIKGVKIDIQGLIMDSVMRAAAIGEFFEKYPMSSSVKVIDLPAPTNYLEYSVINGLKKGGNISKVLHAGKYSLFETYSVIEKFIKSGAIKLFDTTDSVDELRREFPEEVETLLAESEYFNEGYNYFKEGLYSQALNEFEKALALFTDNPIVYLYLAVCNIYLSKLKEAVEILKRILKINPEHPFVYVLLAKIFFRLKKDENAVGYLNQGLKLNRRNIALLWELANYYYRIRDLSRATEEYKKILEIVPSDVRTYLKLGAIYLKEGNKAQAIEAWNHALKHDPENSIAKANLKNLGES